jgi:hypothetical protein
MNLALHYPTPYHGWWLATSRTTRSSYLPSFWSGRQPVTVRPAL